MRRRLYRRVFSLSLTITSFQIRAYEGQAEKCKKNISTASVLRDCGSCFRDKGLDEPAPKRKI
jgi:hypothetical protein